MEQVERARDPVTHHYVPRTYLAAFTHTGRKRDGGLWAHPRDPNRRAFHTGLRRVAAEHGLLPTDAFERTLAEEIEAPFIGWLQRVVHGSRFGLSGALERLTRHEVVELAQFVIVQQLRTPAERARSKRLGDLAFEEHMALPSTRAAIADFYKERFAPKEPVPRRQRKAALTNFQEQSRKSARLLTDARRHHWLNPLGRLTARSILLVLDREWRLVELPDDVARRYPLITCDDPVLLARPRRAGARRGLPSGPGWDVDLGGGWDEPGVQTTITLSPRHALMMAREPDAFGLADDAEAFARAVRVRTARAAMDWAFARDEDDEVHEILRASARPHMELVVGGIPFGPEVPARTILDVMDAIGTNTTEVRRAG